MSQALNFSRPLIAAVHKGQAPVLVADSVAAAAAAYAMNAGASNLVQAVRSACLTTEAGKPRTPAAGTAAALILAAMDGIVSLAPDAGARKGRDDARTPADRQTVADEFAAIRRAAFVAAVQAAADERKKKADERKAAAAEPAAVADPASGSSTSGSTAPAMVANVRIVGADEALAALLALTDSELFALAAKNASGAQRLAAVLGMPAAAAPAAAPAAAAAADAIGKAKRQRGATAPAAAAETAPAAAA